MTELSEEYLQHLADSTADWMQCLFKMGFEELLTEGLMVLPIGKNLIAEKWKIAGERSNHQLFERTITTKYKSYDITASRDGENLLVQLKFLKPSKGKDGLLKRGAALNRRRIVEDMGGLILPGVSCGRLLIIGIHPYVTGELDVVDDLLKVLNAHGYKHVKSASGQEGSVRVITFSFLV